VIPAFRSLDRDTGAGEPLPPVFKAFDKHDVRLYLGELALWAGPPGGGKSTLALQYSVSAQVPTLYVSCDMGGHMTAVKLYSILTGKTNKQVEQDLRDPAQRDRIRDGIAQGTQHLFISHASRPTPEAIAGYEMAFEEIWGHPPSLLVLDNAMNVVHDRRTEEIGGLRELSQVMHWLAQTKEMSALMLHHVNLSGGGNILTQPAPMSALKGQISELPALIGTVCARPQEGKLLYASVKNRHGEADPTAKRYLELDFHGPSGRITDPATVTYESSYTGPSYYERGDDR
jgi:hypothetical protein